MSEPMTEGEKLFEKGVLSVFDVALLVKVANGALEVGAAILVLTVPPRFILRVADALTGGELGGDADDPITAAIRGMAHSFAVHSHYLLALYLALHGVVKMVLVLGVFLGKRAAYQLLMFALVVFSIYETYRGAVRGEILLLALALFDFSLLILTAYEYRRRYMITQ